MKIRNDWAAYIKSGALCTYKRTTTVTNFVYCVYDKTEQWMKKVLCKLIHINAKKANK